MSITQSEALKRVLSLDQLPTLPDVMVHILEVLEDESSCADDITEILAADPIISARILRLANSAFFGSRFEIDSIHRAVVTVGFEAVKQLALATSVMDSLANRSQPSLDPEDYWMHSLGSAKAAQLLAFSTRQITLPEACFTGGLLHDIGKFILALSLQEGYGAVLEAAERVGTPLATMEQRLLKTDHAEVGGWLTQRWSFPEIIVAAVRNSIAPMYYDGPYKKEILIVSLASSMARLADFGHGGETTDATLQEEYIDALGLEQNHVNDICENLAKMKGEGRALLGVLREA